MQGYYWVPPKTSNRSRFGTVPVWVWKLSRIFDFQKHIFQILNRKSKHLKIVISILEAFKSGTFQIVPDRVLGGTQIDFTGTYIYIYL
jgi:hypothetical protein